MLQSRGRALGMFASGVFSGVALSVGALVMHTAHRYSRWHPALPPPLAARRFNLEPFDPSQDEILTGDPKYRGKTLAVSYDGRANSGLFECDGPSKFTWRYDDDEVIYIIEGSVTIEHTGGRFTLAAGDSAFFPAGVVATWTVPQHVRKAFFAHAVGPIVRSMRELDPWQITVTAEQRRRLSL